MSFTLLFAFMVGTIQGQNLQDHRWENRVLIVKSEAKAFEQYSHQRVLLDIDPAGMRERKLVVYFIAEGHYSFRNYTEDDQNRAPFKAVDKRLAKYLDAKKDFQVILIGLDGGVKLEREKEITLTELFRIIDSMPMRASEMRNKKG